MLSRRFTQTNFSILRSLLLVLVAGWTTVSAQETLNYGIVSPNTKTNLNLRDAIAGMNSAAESKLMNEAINLSCVVRSRIKASRALGSWSDGAEPSVLVRVRGDERALRYVLSRMGRDAEQKYVIYFHPEPKGPADLYILKLRQGVQNLVGLTNALERAGIPFRTLVPSGGTTAIYIIDLDRDLRAKIMAAARTLRARVSQESGNAQLFGHDERRQAKVKFEEEINTYEAKNPNLPPPCDVQKARAKGH